MIRTVLVYFDGRTEVLDELVHGDSLLDDRGYFESGGLAADELPPRGKDYERDIARVFVQRPRELLERRRGV